MHGPTCALRIYELKSDFHILEMYTLPNKTMTPLPKNNLDIYSCEISSIVSTKTVRKKQSLQHLDSSALIAPMF